MTDSKNRVDASVATGPNGAGHADPNPGATADSVSDRTPEVTLRAGLTQLFVDVAAEIAKSAPVCELSGRCCRFREFEHTLFISRVEAELLLENGLPPNSTVSEDNCPFQINNLCTARERRPLGCRIFYCDPNYTDEGPRISEWAIGKLKAMHRETETDWEYRPLVYFLREHQASVGG